MAPCFSGFTQPPVHSLYRVRGVHDPTDRLGEREERDEQLLRRANRVSQRSAKNGSQPFGALLANPAGNVLLEAENSSVTEKDPTAHAETNFVKLAVSRRDRNYHAPYQP